ncbi:MAG TPA: zinc-ribbon domain-containing protein [Syntrophomonadaceae bacterium]|nr:zinc-ribbon domain-containing protein [Syntrophomonadaceae bacterium]
MFCPKCGSEVDQQNSFCTVCGNPIDFTDQHNSASEKTPAGLHSINNTPSKIIIGVIIAAVSILLIFICYKPQPQHTVTRCIKAINNNDIDRIMSCLEPEVENYFKELDADEQAMELDYLQAFSINDHKILSKEIDGNEAEILVAVVVDYPDSDEPEPEMLKFILKKFNKGWRIMDMEYL